MTRWSARAGRQLFLVTASIALLLSIAAVPDGAVAQGIDYGHRLGLQRGGEVSYEPVGSGVLFDALDPAVRRWYVPQELFLLYRWKQWEYTNYARDHYQRYLSPDIEGDYFYDLYGSFITKGWLIYDWRQQQPQQFGSAIFKDPRFGAWFNRLVISSDRSGQYHTALTIGEQIRTTLTPMTFSKPAFDGVQMDLQSDKHAVTVLMSRISSPGRASTITVEGTNSTNLLGFRGTSQIGDFVKVGATYVNAHHSQTLLESLEGDPISGALTVGQNLEPISQIFVRLSDDSPTDREGGAALFSHDIIIEAETEVVVVTDDGEEKIEIRKETVRGSEIGFSALINGGFRRRGFLAADGSEQIVLTYDFTSENRSYNGPDLSTIRKVTIELAVANDYRIEMGSDRQTNLPERQPVFLTQARAAGNVKDGSNLQLVRFDYGLPTGNDIFGGTIEVNDLLGFDLYAEFDRSRRFRKYPNRKFTEHLMDSDEASAWMINLARRGYAFFLFGELYNMDYDYGTTGLLTEANGDIDYTNERRFFYEFVEDNDDQDRTPDWQRINQAGPDREIFPGWDENNDFISDFNQNDTDFRPNYIPDYEEPFLRYSVDRPEFLFGVDMNNNFWIDRFENDEDPDFPYDRDRRGGNIYVGAHIMPGMRVTVGRKQERALASDRQENSSYGMFTWDRDIAGLGQLRVFDMVKLVEDTIPDDVVQWVQPAGTEANLQRVPDLLAAPNTWINSAYLGFDYTGSDKLKLVNKVKYDVWYQREEQADFRDQYQFFGLINKAEYRQQLGRFRLFPKIKNELRFETPLLSNEPVRKEDTLILFLIGQTPILTGSEVQVGVEYTLFNQFEEDAKALGLQEDFQELVLAVQYSNTGAYLGYALTTQLGVRINRIDEKGQNPSTGISQFITVIAGLD